MNENQILSKLKTVKDKGNIKDIDFLFNCLQSDNSSIAKESFDILVDIKVKSANKKIVEKIRQERNNEILSVIVSICWQSSLDFSEDLLLFFDLVVDGDLPVAIEAISVIENTLSKNSIDEDVKNKGLHILNKYIENTENDVKTLMIKDFINTFYKDR